MRVKGAEKELSGVESASDGAKTYSRIVAMCGRPNIKIGELCGRVAGLRPFDLLRTLRAGSGEPAEAAVATRALLLYRGARESLR